MRTLPLCAVSAVLWFGGACRVHADGAPPPAAPAEPDSKYIAWVPDFTQAVNALLELMDSALTAESMHKSTPPPPPAAGAPAAGGAGGTTPPAPEGGAGGAPAPTGPVPGSPEAQRAAWITSTLDLVRKG